MRFFLILNRDGEIRLSPFAEADSPSEQGLVLSQPFPLGFLRDVLKSLGPGSPHGIDRETLGRDILRAVRAGSEREAAAGTRGELLPEWGPAACPPKDADEESYRDFCQRVSGRQLLGGDLNRVAREMAVSPEQVWRWADRRVRKSLAGWFPAVSRREGKWLCRRCGEEAKEWPGQYGPAATCPECAALGAATSLEVLYRDYGSLSGNAPANCDFAPRWPLTAAQSAAAEEVLRFVERDGEKEALVWAACGAGKTEMCFPAVAWALSRTIPVLFAAPRQDVVHDVAPRLRRDFPGLPVQVLSGSVSRHYEPGVLVLATTHQILRFYRAFGLVFLDEMDAFPYAGNRMLAWGVRQAMRPEGKLLWLSATPSRDVLAGAKKGSIPLIRLPARHHGQPLPVPHWERLSLDGRGGCPATLCEKLRDLARLGPVLVFVPKISWVAAVLAAIRRCLPDLAGEGSYSADPRRREKIEGLRQGRYRFFVTTSILERGVTLPGVQVAVLAADHPVFDERALVQMAGRAGRTKDCPDGQVVFFAERETACLKKARRWIEEQNRFAREEGLLASPTQSAGELNSSGQTSASPRR
ncbi:UvrABC system protein B [Peptococcaceae bacterium CEB3]|nr:UvrABC system protein B [Peptococcaceae bacterium CEB3]